MSALSVVVLLLGSLLEILDLTAVMLAAIILVIVYEEVKKGALSVYFVTLVIAFILVPNKLVACEYCVIAIYPIIKPIFDRLFPVLMYTVKGLYMVLTTLAIVLLMKYVFISDSPMYFDLIFALGGVVMLILFDVLIFRFTMYYRFKLRNQLKIDKFFY